MTQTCCSVFGHNAIICTCQESLCLPYAGFLLPVFKKHKIQNYKESTQFYVYVVPLVLILGYFSKKKRKLFCETMHQASTLILQLLHKHSLFTFYVHFHLLLLKVQCNLFSGKEILSQKICW